jgi:hypothetical protein
MKLNETETRKNFFGLVLDYSLDGTHFESEGVDRLVFLCAIQPTIPGIGA